MAMATAITPDTTNRQFTSTEQDVLFNLIKCDGLSVLCYRTIHKNLLDKNIHKLNGLRNFILKKFINKTLEDLNSEEVRVCINEFLTTFSVPKCATAISNMYTFNPEELKNMFGDANNINAFIYFWIFGCKDSSDIDVAVVVDNAYSQNGKLSSLSGDAMTELLARLTALGYDTKTRKVDIVIICVSENKIIGFSKGGQELTNVIVFTRDAHIQEMHDLDDIYKIKIIKITGKLLGDKVTACAKYILVKLINICSRAIYMKILTNKKSAFVNNNTRLEGMLDPNIIDNIIYDPELAIANGLDLIEFHNTWKSIIMKLLQIIQLHDSDVTHYHKEELAFAIRNMSSLKDNSIDDIEKFVNGALWYLYRGKRGAFCRTLFTTLHKIYCEIVKETLFYNSNLITEMIYTKIDDRTIAIISTDESAIISTDESAIIPTDAARTTIPINIVNAFINSPVTVTPEFTMLWESKFGRQSVNQIFKSDVTDIQTLIKQLDINISDKTIIPKFIECIWLIQQRSDEWLGILSSKTLICGKNSACVKSDDVQGVYNLIRGALTESIIIDLLSKPILRSEPNTQKLYYTIQTIIGEDDIFCLSVGFIGMKKHGSNGCCPDLIILGKNKIIPVEIKTLKSSDHNSDWRRGISLAMKQNIRTRDILLENGIGVNSVGAGAGVDDIQIEYSLIILCCWHANNILNMEIIKQNYVK